MDPKSTVLIFQDTIPESGFSRQQLNSNLAQTNEVNHPAKTDVIFQG